MIRSLTALAGRPVAGVPGCLHPLLLAALFGLCADAGLGVHGLACGITVISFRCKNTRLWVLFLWWKSESQCIDDTKAQVKNKALL